jgi:hypothetical protein
MSDNHTDQSSVSRAADRIIVTAALVDLPIAAWEYACGSHSVELAGQALLALFAAGVTVKIAVAVRRRQWDAWLGVDAALIVAIILMSAVVHSSVVLLGALKMARIAHLGRHCAHLRHIIVGRNIKTVLVNRIHTN